MLVERAINEGIFPGLIGLSEGAVSAIGLLFIAVSLWCIFTIMGKYEFEFCKRWAMNTVMFMLTLFLISFVYISLTFLILDIGVLANFKENFLILVFSVIGLIFISFIIDPDLIPNGQRNYFINVFGFLFFMFVGSIGWALI